MDRRIMVLAAASFAMGTEAYVYAGHLETLARDLGQPVAIAGQLATAFALTYALTAAIVAGAVARFGRRSVLLAGLALIGGFNLLAAFVPSLGALMVLRVLCGLAAGMVGPIASAAAADLALPEKRGQAMAVVLAGLTLAFVLGIPTGSVVGDLFGWRATFLYAGLTVSAAALAIRIVLPAMAGGKRAGLEVFGAALQPAIAHYLALTLIGFAATFTAIAYVGPIVTAISGLTGSGIGAIQAFIGIGSIIGVVLGGRVADTGAATRVLVTSFLVSAVSLSVYSVLIGTTAADAALPLLSMARGAVVLTLSLGTIVGAAALFSRTPIIQARLVGAASVEARPVVLALNGSMVFLGQGLGAAIGGATVAAAGLPLVGFAGAAVALVGAALALKAAPRPAILTRSAE